MMIFGLNIVRFFLLVFAASFYALANAATPVSSPILGTIQTSKNWTYGCDNILHCDAIALLPLTTPDGFLTLRLSRSYDAFEFQIQITGLKGKGDRYQIFIDDRLSDTGQIDPNSGAANIGNADAMKLARAMARGKLLIIRDASQAIIGRVSLSGSMDAFRYLDKKQMRSGTSDAIVTRGKRTIRPNPPRIPVVSMAHFGTANDIPSASSLVALAEGGTCAKERVGVTQDAVYDLGVASGIRQVLALISCGNGTYNSFSAAYIGTKEANGEWKFVSVQFDYDATVNNIKGDTGLLVNARWDTSKLILSTTNNSSGIGDCGSSAEYVWEGAKFHLTRARGMKECRGALDWITLWQTNIMTVRPADPKLKN